MKPRRDGPFFLGLALLGGLYAGLILAMLVADLAATSPGHLLAALRVPEIRAALWLSLISSSAASILALGVAVPLGYLLARTEFPGKRPLELLLEVPVVLPPLVVGLSLLILFQSAPGRAVQELVTITFAVPAVVLAQFTIAAAFATRTMRDTFAQLSPRTEQIARSLGCTRAVAFRRITLPEARRGVLAAFTLAWARSIGEFGPVLIFAGVTRYRTEVLPTTVFLELSVGNVETAVAVSMLLIAVSAAALGSLRLAFGRM